MGNQVTTRALIFSVYSTDNVDPTLAVDTTSWDFDVWGQGEYDPRFEWEGRGANILTFGGRVDQFYGFNLKDRKIRIAGIDLTEAIRKALQLKYETDSEWNFTDGIDVFRVRFSIKPSGFSAALNGLWLGQGIRGFTKATIQEIYQSQTLLVSNFLKFKYTLLLRVVSQLV